MKPLLPLLFAIALTPITPAQAPANATGICRDGTYSTAASKDGACRGHKGVQTWYAAPPTSTAKPPAAPASASNPAPTPAAAPSAVKPVPVTSAPLPPAPTRSGPAASAAAKPQAPGAAPNLVWLNTASNVYHCPGTDFYGKTKTGTYITEADAKAKGARPNRNQPCKTQP